MGAVLARGGAGAQRRGRREPSVAAPLVAGVLQDPGSTGWRRGRRPGGRSAGKFAAAAQDLGVEEAQRGARPAVSAGGVSPARRARAPVAEGGHVHVVRPVAKPASRTDASIDQYDRGAKYGEPACTTSRPPGASTERTSA